MRKNLHSKFYFLKMLFLKCGKSVIIKKKSKKWHRSTFRMRNTGFLITLKYFSYHNRFHSKTTMAQ